MLKLWLIFIVGSLMTSGGYQISENEVPLSVDTGTPIEESVEPQELRSSVQPEYVLFAELVDVNEPVSQFLVEDIDGDGIRETIVVFGLEDTAAYCFRERETDIQVLGRFDGKGYSTGEIKLIRLQDLIGQYIWIEVSNGMNLNGFAIYEVKGDELKLMAYSASATGSGDDYIEDVNEDGRIDGYVQMRSSYDVLYFPTYRQFSLYNGQFEHTNTSMDLDSYPIDPNDVVDQYLKLMLLNEASCVEAVERLELLNGSQQNIEFVDIESWIDAFVVGSLEYKVAIDARVATVQLEKENTHLIFNLKKLNDQWRISEIIQ